MTSTAPVEQDLAVGREVPGYAVLVVNEHQVRAAAWILLLGGSVAYAISLWNYDPALMKPFGFLFMWDMMARTALGERYSPTLRIGAWLVRGKEPYWVGAKAKAFAWYLGLGMALAACFTMGWLGAPAWVTLAICGVCVSFLFLEAAFGICVGCRLQAIFSNDPPEHCPGGTCPMPHHDHPAGRTGSINRAASHLAMLEPTTTDLAAPEPTTTDLATSEPTAKDC